MWSTNSSNGHTYLLVKGGILVVYKKINQKNIT